MFAAKLFKRGAKKTEEGEEEKPAEEALPEEERPTEEQADEEEQEEEEDAPEKQALYQREMSVSEDDAAAEGKPSSGGPEPGRFGGSSSLSGPTGGLAEPSFAAEAQEEDGYDQMGAESDTEEAGEPLVDPPSPAEPEDLAAEDGAHEETEDDDEDVQSAKVEGEEVDTVELGEEVEVKVTPAQNASVEQPFSKENARGARSMTLSTNPPAEAVLDENGDAQQSPIPDELKDNDFGTLKIGNDGNMTLEAYDGPAQQEEQPAGLAPPAGSASPSEDPPTPQSDLTPQSSPSLQRPRGMSIERSPDVEQNMRQHLAPGPTISPDQQKLLDEMGLGAGPTGFSKRREVHMMASDVMMETMEAQLGISWRRDMDREAALDEARMQFAEHFAGQAIFKEAPPNEPSYDPADFEHLVVNNDISTMFQFITSYTPQTIELENRLKPFIPDFIPAIGDIDAFIKVERPDGKADSIGLSVLDEPRAQQSDKNVLDLQLRAVAKTTTTKQSTVATVPNADRNPKAVEKWIKDIGDLHRSKPAPSVHYNKPMPDIDYLMQEWPTEFEEVLQGTHLPTADLDCDLATYVEIICSIMDIPVYKSKVQSLHVLFTLYSAFKQSGHFGQQEPNPNYQSMQM